MLTCKMLFIRQFLEALVVIIKQKQRTNSIGNTTTIKQDKSYVAQPNRKVMLLVKIFDLKDLKTVYKQIKTV